MVILGLLLVIAALVVGALAIYDFPHTSASQVHVEHLGTSLSPTTIFLLGALSALALLLGLWLMWLGARHRARRRRELHQLRRDQRTHDREAHRAAPGETERSTSRTVVDEHGHDSRGYDTRGRADERVVREDETVRTDEGRDGATGWRR